LRQACEIFARFGRVDPALLGTLEGTALSLRRRRDDLVLRLAGPTLAPPASRRGLGVVVELGARILSGTVR